jgi:hypothetical protein
MALKNEIQFRFVAPAVLFFSVHNEGGVRLSPVADGFIEATKGLDADKLDTNALSILVDQLVYPGAEVFEVLFQVLWVLIQILLVSFCDQADPV